MSNQDHENSLHKHDIAALRKNYTQAKLDESEVHFDPQQQFELWFKDALNSEVLEANAMVLSTVNAKGQPSSRVVLLKGITTRGLLFFTNYDSRKGQELDTNPLCALNFTWLELERQVRIEGRVEKISAEDSMAYFQSRPRDSQIGAWASKQSSFASSRKELEDAFAEYANKFASYETIPLPKNWGGYLVLPHYIEFWQGRESRLHDRIRYAKDDTQTWNIVRLAP